jgi:regulator of cell morphogenesis and NO signaling
MKTEERYLFPYIASMESPGGVDTTVIFPLFGTVRHPLKSLQHQHSVDRDAFETIRAATNNFTDASGHCDGVSRLYSGLKQFNQELSDHLALEDGFLFPRAVRVEKEVWQR